MGGMCAFLCNISGLRDAMDMYEEHGRFIIYGAGPGLAQTIDGPLTCMEGSSCSWDCGHLASDGFCDLPVHCKDAERGYHRTSGRSPLKGGSEAFRTDAVVRVVSFLEDGGGKFLHHLKLVR
jgi:hypothetical protein